MHFSPRHIQPRARARAQAPELDAPHGHAEPAREDRTELIVNQLPKCRQAKEGLNR